MSESSAISYFFPVAMVACIATILFRGLFENRRVDQMRREAMETFRRTVVDSQDPLFRFRGDSAVILKIEEPPEGRRQPLDEFVLTLFARNESGEYFMFKSTRPRPFVKHVSHRIAKHVLKEAYVAPPAP